MSPVVTLMNQIGRGDVVLPGIQRDFVWDEDRIAMLLDSIMRGYPIGIALLWETYNDIQYRAFDRDYVRGTVPSYSENSKGKKLRLVLDGQQRLQSLYVALFGTHNGRRMYFDVLSGQEADDLSGRRYRFEFLKPFFAKSRNETRKREHWLPVGDVFNWTYVQKSIFRKDLAAANNLLDDDTMRLDFNFGRLDDALMKDANVLHVSTIDEDLPIDNPARKTEADVLEIFVRINREGMSLSRSDLIFSMLKLNWKESAEQLPEFLKKVNTGNSLGVDTDFVIRCLFVTCGLGGKIDIDILRTKSNIAKLQENFAQCCSAIEATVDFVIQLCKCEAAELTGGLGTLVPFVYYFYRLPNHQLPNSGITAAKKVFYLFALAKPFSRYGESRGWAYIRDNIKPAMDRGDYVLSASEAIGLVRRGERIVSVDGLLQANEVLSLHLLQGLSGAKVQYAGNRPEVDHIFPRAVLMDKGYAPEEINHVANYWILALGKNRNKSAKPPALYFGDVDESVMGQAAIDPEMLKTYRGYRRFLKARLTVMAERVASRIHLSKADVSLLESDSMAVGDDDDLGDD